MVNTRPGTGPLQIVPTGAHDGIEVDDTQVFWLLMAGYIYHDHEHGPHTNTFRPVGTVDAEGVKRWLR